MCVCPCLCVPVVPPQRLAAGSFTETLKFLFRLLTGTELSVTQYGKPLPVTFRYAMDTLVRWKEASGLGTQPFTKVFMTGDNPPGDVRGANNAGGCGRMSLRTDLVVSLLCGAAAVAAV